MGHVHRKDLEKVMPEHLGELEKKGYPYDIVYFRWNVGGDNGPPDEPISDVVKNWNAKHAYPKLIIATTTELFREFEKRYADEDSRRQRRLHAVLGERGRLRRRAKRPSTARPPSDWCRPKPFRRCSSPRRYPAEQVLPKPGAT